MDFPGKGALNSLTTLAVDQAAGVGPKRFPDKPGQLAPMDPARQRADLEKAAQEFEAVFLNTLLKAMRQTVPTNELFNGGGATKFYRQMHDAEVAKSLATGHAGMGIADMIVRQLSLNLDNQPDPNEKAGPVQGPTAPEASVPRALARYRQAATAGPEISARQRLARLAAEQSGAVADTLQRFQPEIERAARDSGLDAALILAVVMEESGGDPLAQSDKGALGLMQLMPETAREVGVTDPANPSQNLRGGARYLADMMDRFAGRLDVALAAYNAGPGTVDRLGGRVPDYPETQRYVKRVLDRYGQLGGGTQLASPGQ